MNGLEDPGSEARVESPVNAAKVGGGALEKTHCYWSEGENGEKMEDRKDSVIHLESLPGVGVPGRECS